MLSENKYWKFVENENNQREEDSFGKWLIFSSWNQVDQTWEIISSAVERNVLTISSAKIAKQFEGNKSKNASICIYTYRDNLQIIREQLRNLGFTNKLCYKANVNTEKLLYGHFSHYICEHYSYYHVNNFEYYYKNSLLNVKFD